MYSDLKKKHKNAHIFPEEILEENKYPDTNKETKQAVWTPLQRKTPTLINSISNELKFCF